MTALVCQENAEVRPDTSSRPRKNPMRRSPGSMLVRMVDSPPSDGESQRDPEPPIPADGCATDPDDSADDEWVRVIEALARRVDRVPEEVVRAARRALHAREHES